MAEHPADRFLTNAMPEFCPWPLKLKPFTVKTLSTLAFSLCR